MVSESFRARADAAAFWEAWVGSVLSRMGLYTIHHPSDIDDTKDHSLTFDLEVDVQSPYTSNAGESLEVKGLNLDFGTTPQSYPFSTLLVCSQNNFQKKWPGSDSTGRDFLYASMFTGNILWLPKGTHVELGNYTLDKTRNELYKTAQAKRSDLRTLKEFVAHVKGEQG